jgi:hypothetical protein
VNTSHGSNSDRVLRTAASFYVAPRVVIGFLLLATLGLGAFMVLVQIGLVILRRLGA